ncbi:hypothetical protein LIER_31074 [Lithospermum erythrorhizon]|uniref:Uncharacterized protein n=1 Tax=Lithospermum erythrorhizon TaxID=34254 RepID=A0AAV3RTG0_LITER
MAEAKHLYFFSVLERATVTYFLEDQTHRGRGTQDNTMRLGSSHVNRGRGMHKSGGLIDRIRDVGLCYAKVLQSTNKLMIVRRIGERQARRGMRIIARGDGCWYRTTLKKTVFSEKFTNVLLLG